MIDLALFRVRHFRLVNVATLVFAAAFYGTLLSNILFLQTVWHYTVLRAALGPRPRPVGGGARPPGFEPAGATIGDRPVLGRRGVLRGRGRRLARARPVARTGPPTGCPPRC